MIFEPYKDKTLIYVMTHTTNKYEQKIYQHNKKHHCTKTLYDLRYFNELDAKTLNTIQKNNIIACDLGEKNLLYTIDENKIEWRYTKKQYYSFTEGVYKKRTKYKIMDSNEVFKFQWYFIIDKEREHKKILDTIENTYGKNITIIVGDMGGSNTTNYDWIISLLSSRFFICKVDEFKTSIVNSNTLGKNENMIVKSSRGDNIILGSVFTYIMPNCRKGCINRDRNGCINMLFIIQYWMQLFNFFYNNKNINECNLIKNDKMLLNFLSKNKQSYENVNKYMFYYGRPEPFSHHYNNHI